MVAALAGLEVAQVLRERARHHALVEPFRETPGHRLGLFRGWLGSVKLVQELEGGETQRDSRAFDHSQRVGCTPGSGSRHSHLFGGGDGLRRSRLSLARASRSRWRGSASWRPVCAR